MIEIEHPTYFRETLTTAKLGALTAASHDASLFSYISMYISQVKTTLSQIYIIILIMFTKLNPVHLLQLTTGRKRALQISDQSQLTINQTALSQD